MFFASTKVGYAVGGGFDGTWGAVAKTVDGGTTWKVVFASTDVAEATSVFFTDENNGVIRLHDRRVLITADGGQTWRGATGTAEATIKFADPQVGWSCIEQYGPSCSITLDGGKSWTAHDIKLPEDIHGYSVPRRDLVYVVGDHGMIYRYRIVPADYTAKGIVDAPLMTSYGGPIVTQLQQMQTQITALQSQLSAAAAASASASGSAAAPPAVDSLKIHQRNRARTPRLQIRLHRLPVVLARTHPLERRVFLNPLPPRLRPTKAPQRPEVLARTHPPED